MPKSFLSSLPLIILLLFAFNTNAQQQDVVVNLAGDTLKCEIKYNLFSAPVKYKLAGDSNYKKFNVKEIKYYTCNKLKQVYRAVLMPKQSTPVFLLLVENGILCLYQRLQYTSTGLGGYTATIWYISKNNDDLNELKSNDLFTSKTRKERKDIFADLIADKPDVLNYYQNTDKFTFMNLLYTVHYYNTGILPQQPVQTTNKP